MARKKQPAAKKPIDRKSVERFESEVQPLLDTLNTQGKIRLLRECIINYEHDTEDDLELPFWEMVDGYYKRCKKALKKFEQLEQLEAEQNPLTATRNPDFTTARQVLAIHYLLQAAGMSYSDVDKSNVARLTEFLTEKNYRNIYDCVRSPLKTSDKSAEKDLKFIRPFFEKLGLTEVVKMIDKELKFTATE